MPDTSAAGYAATLQGEHAMQADHLRRKAAELRRQAAELDAQAAWHDERAEWAGELAEAHMAQRGEGE